MAASRLSRGLTSRGKAPEPARPAAAAPPSLRGRGSQAPLAAPETAGRSAGPLQAGHAGPAGSEDSQQLVEAGERCGKRLCGRSCRGSWPQHRGCTGQPTGNFPPKTKPVQTSYCRRSLHCRRVFSFLSRFSGLSGDREGPEMRRPSSEFAESLQFQDAANPAFFSARAQRLGARCHFANLSRFPGLFPQTVPPTGQRLPASCAQEPSGAAPLPPQRSARSDSFFCSWSPQNAGPGSLHP